MDCSPPGSSVPGILQARILELVAIAFSRGSTWPRDRSQVSCIADRFFTIFTREAQRSYPGDRGKRVLRIAHMPLSRGTVCMSLTLSSALDSIFPWGSSNLCGFFEREVPCVLRLNISMTTTLGNSLFCSAAPPEKGPLSFSLENQYKC